MRTSAPVEQWHRLSPRMLLIHPITELVRSLPALVGVFFAGSGTHSGHWGTLAAAGAVALLSLTRWFTTRLRITPTTVQLRRGLLRRRTLTASRERIRTVDVTAHVLHRALGLARVVVGTGTNDRKGERAGLVLDGLPVATARRLRDELLHPVVPAPSTIEAAPESTALARLDRRWIRLAPLTLSGVVSGVIIWGFFWRVQSESQVDLLHRGPLRSVTQWFEQHSAVAGVLVAVAAVAVFVAVTSTLGYVLAFWNFTLTRHPGGTLEVTRGLLTTRATSIERRRLAGVHVSEPLPLRWAQAARLTAVATGLRAGRGAERGGEVLLPPAPVAVVRSVAADVLDGVDPLAAGLRAHPPAARGRRLLRSLAGALAVAAATVGVSVAAGTGWPLAVGVLALLGAVPLGLDRYAALGHALSAGYLITRNGAVVRRRTALAEAAVIGWTFRSSWLQRRQGLVTLVATTAAGAQGYPITDLDGDDATALARGVTPDVFAGLLSGVRASPATAR